jgi:hypothetical protein
VVCNAYRESMKILAHSQDWYVIETSEGEGRVFDRERLRLFPVMSLVSILSKGTWEPFTGDVAPVLEDLSRAEDLAPEWQDQESLKPLSA